MTNYYRNIIVHIQIDKICKNWQLGSAFFLFFCKECRSQSTTLAAQWRSCLCLSQKLISVLACLHWQTHCLFTLLFFLALLVLLPFVSWKQLFSIWTNLTPTTSLLFVICPYFFVLSWCFLLRKLITFCLSTTSLALIHL